MIYSVIDVFEYDESGMKLLEQLGNAISKSEGLSLKLKNNSELKSIPRSIVYLKGKLTVILEDLKLGKLQECELEQIKSINLLKDKFEALIPDQDVKSYFIYHRSRSVREVRLVIESTSLQRIPKNQFELFRNIMSYKTEKNTWIWSAYVEVCEDLYLWLDMIKSKDKRFKILGPVCVKSVYHLSEEEIAS